MAIQKEIIVKHGIMTKLEKDCNASSTSVRNALRGSVETDLAKLIRKRAMENYGGVYRPQPK